MGDGYWRPGNVHPFPSSGRFGSPQWNRKKSKKQEKREDRKRKSKSPGYQTEGKRQKKKGNSLQRIAMTLTRVCTPQTHVLLWLRPDIRLRSATARHCQSALW